MRSNAASALPRRPGAPFLPIAVAAACWLATAATTGCAAHGAQRTATARVTPCSYGDMRISDVVGDGATQSWTAECDFKVFRCTGGTGKTECDLVLDRHDVPAPEKADLTPTPAPSAAPPLPSSEPKPAPPPVDPHDAATWRPDTLGACGRATFKVPGELEGRTVKSRSKRVPDLHVYSAKAGDATVTVGCSEQLQLLEDDFPKALDDVQRALARDLRGRIEKRGGTGNERTFEIVARKTRGRFRLLLRYSRIHLTGLIVEEGGTLPENPKSFLQGVEPR